MFVKLPLQKMERPPHGETYKALPGDLVRLRVDRIESYYFDRLDHPESCRVVMMSGDMYELCTTQEEMDYLVREHIGFCYE